MQAFQISFFDPFFFNVVKNMFLYHVFWNILYRF